MKRPKLLLLTMNFPYLPGEEFLETEIVYLAAHFDVVIAPFLHPKNTAHRRPLPANVTVLTNVIEKKSRIREWMFEHPLKAADAFRILLHACGRLRCDSLSLRQLLQFVVSGMRFESGIIEKLKYQKVDIVYSYWLKSPAFTAILLKDHSFARAAIARAHRGDLYEDQTALGSLPGQPLVAKGLDRIFCISEHGCRYLRQKYSAYDDKFVLSRLGVAPAPIQNQPSEDGRLHIASCAYLSPVKRIDLWIKSLAHCSIPITWTHLGGGQMEEALREQAQSLPAHIRWQFTGALSNQDVLRFYQENAVDLFINVSASEGLPVSIMEAMSFGIPVAATDVGGVGELVRPGANGFLWPADVTPDTIADTIHHFFLLSETQKKAMREAAWQTWRDRVNAEVQYPEFAQQLLALT